MQKNPEYNDPAPSPRASRPARQLSLDDLPSILVREGLLDPKDVVDGTAIIEDRTRRNRNFLVKTGKGGVMVKQAGNTRDPRLVRGTLTEARLLFQVANDPSFRRLRWFSPRLVYASPEDAMLATELVYPATSLTKLHLNLGGIEFSPEVAATCGRLLARFHRIGGEGIAKGRLHASPADMPFIWNATEPQRMGFPGGTDAMAAFHATLASSVDLASRVPTWKDQWERGTDLVHGDVRWDNILVTHGAAPGDNHNLRLIDWELAGRGDGAWDAACFLGEYIRFWFMASPTGRMDRFEDFQQTARFPLEHVHDSARSFVATYCEDRRTNGDGAAGELRERMVGYLPGVLVLIGYEQLQGQQAMPGTTRLLIAMAKELAESPENASDWLGLEVDRR